MYESGLSESSVVDMPASVSDVPGAVPADAVPVDITEKTAGESLESLADDSGTVSGNDIVLPSYGNTSAGYVTTAVTVSGNDAQLEEIKADLDSIVFINTVMCALLLFFWCHARFRNAVRSLSGRNAIDE